MHISLDSALGRQRRLNQIGETITSIAAPAAAYSLRSLTGGDPLAVRVRREVTAASSFQSEKDFTVSEVASGALVDFVNSTVFTRTNELALDAGAGFVGLGENIKCIVGTRYKVTFELKQNSGGSGTVSGNPRFRTSSTFAYSNVVKSSNITESTNRFEVNAATTAYQSYSIEFTVDSGTAADKNFTFQNLDSDDGYTARNINIEVVAGNGLVTIWYDQIGSNNLVQTDTAKQPLIVDSGSLFLNTDGEKGISIERSSTRETKLDFTSGFTIANSHTFQYLEFKRTFVDVLLSANGGGNIRIGRQSGTNLQIKNGTTQTFAAGITVHNNPFLYTTFLAADGSASKVHINGVEKQNTVYPDRDASQPNFTQIGKAGSNASTPAFILSELLMYSSEQSNRAAIEANMDSKYSIF